MTQELNFIFHRETLPNNVGILVVSLRGSLDSGYQKLREELMVRFNQGEKYVILDCSDAQQNFSKKTIDALAELYNIFIQARGFLRLAGIPQGVFNVVFTTNALEVYTSVEEAKEGARRLIANAGVNMDMNMDMDLWGQTMKTAPEAPALNTPDVASFVNSTVPAMAMDDCYQDTVVQKSDDFAKTVVPTGPEPTPAVLKTPVAPSTPVIQKPTPPQPIPAVTAPAPKKQTAGDLGNISNVFENFIESLQQLEKFSMDSIQVSGKINNYRVQFKITQDK